MTFRKAIKLHSGDQVKVKATGEFVTVIVAYRDQSGKYLMVDATTADDGHKTFNHLEIS